MNTRFAFLGLAAATGLVAFVGPKDEVRFAVAEGTTLTKSFETSMEMSLDDLIISFNGQELDPAAMGADFDLADANGSFGYVLSVVDEYGKMADGKPAMLRRTIDTLMGEYSSGMGDSGSESAPIEGETLVYTWDAEEDAYAIKLDSEDAAIDPEEYEMMAEDLDLRSMLPKDSVSEGDSWTIGGRDMMGVLVPGLDVNKAIDAANEEASNGDVPIELEEFMDSVAEGMVLELTYAGTREVDGRSLMVIEIGGDFEQNLDLSDMILEAISAEMPPEASVDLSVVIEMAAEATGEMLWDGKAGHFVSMDMEMDFVMVIDARGDVDAGGQAMDGGIEAEASMHMVRKATAE